MKIDFVIPWVNGEDENWLSDRKKFSDKLIINNDYRDWGIFKYWFRAVEKYAPWVNNIYLITYGHLPKFLNLNHPKLKIINHKDYIPSEYLPTFSSHVIELNLHRIDSLSDNFVYFNDDTFITNPMRCEDFFKDNLPRATAFVNPVAPARYDTISNIMVNNVGVVNSHIKKNDAIKRNLFKWFNYRYGIYNLLNIMFIPWSKFLGFYEDHQPTAFMKKTFQEVWEKEFDILDITCRNKVRDMKVDVNQWLIKNWQIASGEFYPRKKSESKFVVVEDERSIKKIENYLFSKKLKLLCINDHIRDKKDEEIVNIINEIQSLLERKFDEKSSFEK